MARIRSTSGDDIRNGTNRNDTFAASAGDDKINGRGGADTLNGGDGDDEFNGGSGNDTLNGQAGNDKLDGGSGTDRLVGEVGDDVLVGGDGNDTFVYNQLGGDEDTIKDFDVGFDVIEVQNFSQAQLDALAASTADVNLIESGDFDAGGRSVFTIDPNPGSAGREGGVVIIDFLGDDVLTVEGVNALDPGVDIIAV